MKILTEQKIINDLIVGEGQRETIVLADGTDLTNHNNPVTIKVEKGATLNFFFSNFSQQQQKIDLKIELAEQSTLNLYGLFSGSDQSSYNLLVNHLGPDSKSKIVIKGILQNNNIGTCLAKVKIDKGADRASTSIEERVLLLNQGARVTMKPDLEISCDSATAKHAATASQIDNDQLFYLSSRGIPKAEAEQMITAGFLNDVLQHFPTGYNCLR